MEKPVLRVSANESYPRIVGRTTLEQPTAKRKVTGNQRVTSRTLWREKCSVRVQDPPPPADRLLPTASCLLLTESAVGGGKVRVSAPGKGRECPWLEYTSDRVETIYHGATFPNNEELKNRLDSQPSISRTIGVGDGRDGVWNLFAEAGEASRRWEIPDRYHLKENP